MKKFLWLIALVLVTALSAFAVACDDEPVDPPTPPAPTEYTVTVPSSPEGGSVTTSADKITEGETLTLTVTESKGYALTFIKVNGTAVTLTNGKYAFTPDADISVTAQFDAVEYEIKYNLDGGVLPEGAPTAYTVKSEKITLPTPTRTGSDFDGWFDAEYTTPVTEIAAGSTGRVDLYAVWRLTEYPITYDLSAAPSGTVNPNTDATYNIDDKITLLPIANTAEYVFDGWVDGDNNPVTELGNGATGAITLRPKFTETGIKMDGAIDASWTSYPKAVVTASGNGTEITAYERLTQYGLFVELRIEHNSALITDEANWWDNSYIAAFVNGKGYDGDDNQNAAVYQHQLTAAGTVKGWTYTNFSSAANGGEFVTVAEMLLTSESIKNFTDGDEYVRVGMGLAWFNGARTEVRVVRGSFGNGGSTEQKYYSNGYFVTQDGIYDLDPTLNHLIVSKPSEGGSLTLSRETVSAANPETVTATLTLNTGWTLETFTVNGEDKKAELIDDNIYEFIPTEHKTEIVAFWDTTRYNITYNGVPSGVSNPNPANFTMDSSITLLPLADTANENFVGWVDEDDQPVTAITGDLLQARTITAVYEDSIRRFDGAIDASWDSYENATVYKAGSSAAAGQSVTVYARMLEDGLFVELKIEHTADVLKTADGHWSLDSYITAFIAGADSSKWSTKNNGLQLNNANPHQHVFTAEKFNERNLWKFADITTTGNATDGFVTVVEMFRDLNGIAGYTSGDDFVRLSMSLAGFNGTANKSVYITSTTTSDHTYTNGLYFVTANGIFVADPTEAAAAWTDAQKIEKGNATIYARLTDGGLYSEIVIKDTKAAPTVNGANWYDNSYIAPWIAGAGYEIPSTGASLGKSVQYQITPSLNNINLTNRVVYYKFGKTTGNATDGYTTVLSMYLPLNAINGYAAGDEYVRMSVCIGGWGSGGTNHIVTGGYTASGNADFYDNGYFVTESGITALDPSIAFDGAVDAAWSGYADAKIVNDADASSKLTAYARLVNGGMFIELKIEHTKKITNGDNWYENGYISAFAVGQGYTTADMNSTGQKYITVADGQTANFTKAAIKTDGNDTDGYITVVELYIARKTLSTFTYADEYARLGLGIANFGDNSTIYRIYENPAAANKAQRYLENAVFVTESGMYTSAPATT